MNYLNKAYRLCAALLFFFSFANANAKENDKIWLSSSINRDGINLSGTWAYSIDPYRDGQQSFHGGPPSGAALRYLDINVAKEMAKNPKTFYEFDFDIAPTQELPGSWNSATPEFRYYDGLMWYQRHFDYKKSNATRTIINFGAVNYKTNVYINGKLIGIHEGGFTPFNFDVTEFLRDGNNQITLGVDSQHTKQTIPPPVTDWDIYGGVTRDIRLINVPKTFIDYAFVKYTEDGNIITSVKLNGYNCQNQVLILNIQELGVKSKFQTNNDCFGEIKIKAPNNIKLWSPETPKLYEVSINSNIDVFKDKIGFRTIKVVGDDIILNGKPIFLRGISMHEEEIGTNPSRNITEEKARALMSEIKNGLHGNYVRLSHYPHSEVTVRLADEMGLLVWSEIPVYWMVDFDNQDVLNNAKNMMAENIMRDRNRASVIIWSVGNETPQSDARLNFLSSLADEARRLDDSRLISAAVLATRKDSEGGTDIMIDDPLLKKLDIAAVNTYNGWYTPDNLADLPRIRWHRVEQKPLIFSEFGADAKIGIRGDENNMKFSEDYQALYYQKTLEMADNVPWLRGLSPWILKDFRSPRRQHPLYQEGWNRKGLISETGAQKKAFKILSDYYEAKEK